jgi:hypothetical protein
VSEILIFVCVYTTLLPIGALQRMRKRPAELRAEPAEKVPKQILGRDAEKMIS